MTDIPNIQLPSDILPADGRFGSGPTKVRRAQIDAIAAGATSPMGTSHRQAPVKNLVGAVRAGLSELFSLPDGWEIVLGNGGTTVFWDAATFGLINSKSQHLSFGEFSQKLATAVAAAPQLDEPTVLKSEPGTYATPVPEAGVDLYALTHNETSTGVAAPLERPAGADDGALVAVDATSAAGGLRWDTSQVDVYYFAPQKCFAADGGLWIAACSPAAVERIQTIAASDRWRPASIDLGLALDNSTKNQTYNTPAVATLIMLNSQLEWMNEHGGLEWAAARSDANADTLYSWAEDREWATPFVSDPAARSSVVGTIDIDDSVDATTISAVLRRNGIVDTDSYRKLGRNQLRIGLFPAIDAADVAALTNCIDVVVEQLSAT